MMMICKGIVETIRNFNTFLYHIILSRFSKNVSRSKIGNFRRWGTKLKITRGKKKKTNPLRFHSHSARFSAAESSIARSGNRSSLTGLLSLSIVRRRQSHSLGCFEVCSRLIWLLQSRLNVCLCVFDQPHYRSQLRIVVWISNFRE